MKIYLKANSDISKDSLLEAMRFANQYKRSIIDKSNHIIIVPLNPGSREDDLMNPNGGWGAYLQSLGFNIAIERGDFEYETFDNRQCGFTNSNKRYLRNRLIMTITW